MSAQSRVHKKRTLQGRVEHSIGQPRLPPSNSSTPVTSSQAQGCAVRLYRPLQITFLLHTKLQNAQISHKAY